MGPCFQYQLSITQLNFNFLFGVAPFYAKKMRELNPKKASHWVSMSVLLIDVYCGPASFDHGQSRWWLLCGWCTSSLREPQAHGERSRHGTFVQICLTWFSNPLWKLDKIGLFQFLGFRFWGSTAHPSVRPSVLKLSNYGQTVHSRTLAGKLAGLPRQNRRTGVGKMDPIKTCLR